MKLRLLFPAVLFTLSLPLVAADAPAAAPSAADYSAFKTADDLWKHIEKLQEKPTEIPTTREEAIVQVYHWYSAQKDAAEAFVKAYPTDARIWQARMIALRTTMQLRQFKGDKTDPAADQQMLDEIINAPGASPSVKGEATFMSVMIKWSALDKRKPEGYAVFYKAMDDFYEKFPEHPLAGELKSYEMRALSEDPTPQADAVLKKLVAGSDPRLAEAATATLAHRQMLAELKTKPFELKFTASDGQPVDMANLRGKVVLVDFWASWCPGCMQEMPDIVSAYGRLHEKGFEIVGISLDQEKEDMEGALKKENMTWLQYFDGAGWENKISTAYGITQLPVSWLIDKKGMLREMDLMGEEIGPAVEKLLAE